MAKQQGSKLSRSTSGPIGPGGPGGPQGRHGSRFAPIRKPKNAKAVLKRLWGYLRQHKSILLLVFFIVVVSSILDLIGPYLLGKAIDHYVIPGDFKGLFKIILLMLSIYLTAALSVLGQDYLMVGVTQKTVGNLRRDLFNKLQVLALPFFDSRPHGELMSRLTNDIDNVNNTLNTTVLAVFSSIVTLAGSLGMMFYLSPTLTLVSLLIIPLMFFLTRLITKRTRTLFLEQQSSLGELNGLIEETLSGQKVIKVFNREAECLKEFEQQNSRLRKVGARAQIFSGIIGPLMNVLNNLSFALVATAGGLLVIKGVISVGVVVSFISYIRFFNRPLNELANQFNMIQSALAGAERVFEILDEPAEPEDGQIRIEPARVEGEVVFDNVSFAYKKGEPVLKKINFSAKPGQVIALVGPTGAGKTTIVNLLSRFYEPESGEIFLDGTELHRIDRRSLRSCLGIVLQDTYLFADTVRENIRYGRLTATDQEVEMAARLANAEQFILRLPEGYETVLTEEGGNLSQGQRQLLAIARAILADPRILILDEATSSVDPRTEVQIQEAMLKLMEGRTSFVIAHRLSTIRNADLILVINNGEIIERGNHEELLRQKGLYFDLYNSQFRREIVS
ncbi:MAG: ABC transporter ATP-binding protein [Firmicutes bacterium]|nr:ABC transporter ATP-binding protein [Bacillota bacterium]